MSKKINLLSATMAVVCTLSLVACGGGGGGGGGGNTGNTGGNNSGGTTVTGYAPDSITYDRYSFTFVNQTVDNYGDSHTRTYSIEWRFGSSSCSSYFRIEPWTGGSESYNDIVYDIPYTYTKTGPNTATLRLTGSKWYSKGVVLLNYVSPTSATGQWSGGVSGVKNVVIAIQ